MRRKAWRILLLTGACLTAAPAQADTLREALALAYENNPTLEAARANQRVTDENVVIERSDALPSANLTGTYTEFLYDSGPSPGRQPAAIDAGLVGRGDPQRNPRCRDEGPCRASGPARLGKRTRHARGDGLHGRTARRGDRQPDG